MRKTLIALAITTLMLCLATSCAWMGEVAGKTVATGKNIGKTVSEKARDGKESMKEGYEQGYEETKKD